MSADVEPRALTAGEARARLDRVRAALGSVWDDLVVLYEGRAWTALGHASWEALCDAELGGARVPADRLERREAVRRLRGAGMSVRAISAATGAGRGTVARDLAGVPDGTPAEGDGAVAADPGTADGTPAPAVPAVEADPPADPPRVVGLDGRSHPAARPAPAPAPAPAPEPAPSSAAAASVSPVSALLDSDPGVRRARAVQGWNRWMRGIWPLPGPELDDLLDDDHLLLLDSAVRSLAEYLDRLRAARRSLRAIDGGRP